MIQIVSKHFLRDKQETAESIIEAQLSRRIRFYSKAVLKDNGVI